MTESEDARELEKTITLHDGRKLGYVEFGDLDGKPVFHFHGWPGSRLEAHLLHEPAIEMGIRLIGVDRPGIGLSDFQPDRTLLDWPNDVYQLADELNLNHFAVQGISGGGAYATVCAYKIPGRLTACNIVSGMGPYEYGIEGMHTPNRILFSIARIYPGTLRPVMYYFSRQLRSRSIEEVEEAMIRQVGGRLPEPDLRVLDDPILRRRFVVSNVEAFRQGSKGPAYEANIYVKPWGFELEDVDYEPIFLWYGELDANVPVDMGRKMADALPNGQLTVYPDDGHLSIFANHYKEIFGALLS
jgi:pimeloyl-ACP methyl ester carboxylesterase